MLLIWLTIAAIIGGVAGYQLCARFIAVSLGHALNEHSFELKQKAGVHASDLNLLLLTFRRELARWMFKEDPDRFGEVMRAAQSEAMEISSLSKVEQQHRLQEISERFPSYLDFDTIGGREYLPYAEALSGVDFTDVSENYRQIMLFQALNVALDPAWKHVKFISPGDSENLTTITQQLQDGRFVRRLQQAVGFFFCYRHGSRAALGSYETDTLSVDYLYNAIETSLGVHFKDTKEYGILSIYEDDAQHVSHQTWYRTNAIFTEETRLHSGLQE